MQWTGQKVMFDLRREIFRHMQRMHIGFFDTHAVGKLVTRLTSDVDAINEMFTAGVLSMIDDLFALTIMVVVMLAMNWKLALLTFSVPAVDHPGVTHLFRKSVRESYRRVRGAIARINSFTQEHVSGMSVVQLFNREERAYRDFTAVNEQHMIAFKDTIFAYALYYPAVEILSSIAIALVVWRGGFGVINSAVTIGVLSAFFQYSQRFFRPIMDLSGESSTYCKRRWPPANGFSSCLTRRLRLSLLRRRGSATVAIGSSSAMSGLRTRRSQPNRRRSSLRPTQPCSRQCLILSGSSRMFRSQVEPGQTVAIVGHTGAGKTTLTGLMIAFLRCDERSDPARWR